jgi:hypothetical protein
LISVDLGRGGMKIGGDRARGHDPGDTGLVGDISCVFAQGRGIIRGVAVNDGWAVEGFKREAVYMKAAD